MELLVSMVNKTDSQLILTTHSPYILSVTPPHPRDFTVSFSASITSSRTELNPRGSLLKHTRLTCPEFARTRRFALLKYEVMESINTDTVHHYSCCLSSEVRPGPGPQPRGRWARGPGCRADRSAAYCRATTQRQTHIQAPTQTN